MDAVEWFVTTTVGATGGCCSRSQVEVVDAAVREVCLKPGSQRHSDSHKNRAGVFEVSEFERIVSAYASGCIQFNALER
jgi:hypothetical protein